MHALVTLAFAFTLVAAKCDSSHGPQLEWSQVASGSHLDIVFERPTLWVLKSGADLKKFGPELREKLASVDFEKQVAVIVAAQVPTGGYQLQIEAIKSTEQSKFIVTAQLSAPPPASMTTMVVSQPYSVVVVPKSYEASEFALDMRVPDRSK